ncbi:MAG: proton-conducting transporter membrane subunit, partial [Sphingomonadaceae bacterium]
MAELSLAVAVPAAAALLAVPMQQRAWWLAPPVAAFALAHALAVARAVPLATALGDFQPPLGILLRADGMAAAFLLMAAVVAGAAALFAIGWFQGRSGTREAISFWPLFFAGWSAVAGVFLLADLFSLFVALELLTIAGVGMVLLSGKSGAVQAAITYLLYALAGSLLFLLGAALLYAGHATLDMALLKARLAPS